MSADLPLLQNRVKRDPDAYRQEFEMQLSHFQSELEIFGLNPSQKAPHFQSLVQFLAQVMPCYPTALSQFPHQLIALVSKNFAVLVPKVRQTIVQALVLIRNRGLLEPIPLFGLFFRLFACEDKTLRKDMFAYVVADVRNQHEKQSNGRRMRQCQHFIFRQLEDDTPAVARKALAVLVELYRRKIWTCARTVNSIAQAVFHPEPKVSLAAMHFFLGIEARIAEDSRSEETVDQSTILSERDIKLSNKNVKKTRKRKRIMAVQLAKSKKLRCRMVNGKMRKPINLFPAIDGIADPQGFAERLFKCLRSTNQGYDVKLVMMNLLSRIVGRHKLMLLNLYSHLQRYTASPTQPQVTHVLAYLVQACHELVPGDDILPVLRGIADNFVTDRRPGDVIAIGINTIRAVCARVPHVLEEPPMKSLARDLCEYKKFRDKGVVIAARGLINDLRHLYPELLKSRDRGKDNAGKGARPAAYGEQQIVQRVGTKGEDSDSDDWGSDSDEDEDGFAQGGGLEADSDMDSDDEYASTIGGVRADQACVSAGMLMGYSFKQRQKKEERLKTVREGRSKYSKEKGGGSTNTEKTRKKNFGMVKFSNAVRQKMKVALKDQQKNVMKQIKTMKRQAKQKHRTNRRKR
jgi:protein SDA1